LCSPSDDIRAGVCEKLIASTLPGEVKRSTHERGYRFRRQAAQQRPSRCLWTEYMDTALRSANISSDPNQHRRPVRLYSIREEPSSGASEKPTNKRLQQRARFSGAHWTYTGGSAKERIEV
jgi:hypothetical protein